MKPLSAERWLLACGFLDASAKDESCAKACEGPPAMIEEDRARFIGCKASFLKEIVQGVRGFGPQRTDAFFPLWKAFHKRKDRYTVLPEIVIPALQEHLRKVQAIHEADLRQGHGVVYLPGALDRKYPAAARDWRWQYVFPARGLSVDPRGGQTRRHHLDEGTINKAIKAAVGRVGLTKRVSSHTFRHNAENRIMPSWAW
jgi:integrase